MKKPIFILLLICLPKALFANPAQAELSRRSSALMKQEALLYVQRIVKTLSERVQNPKLYVQNHTNDYNTRFLFSEVLIKETPILWVMGHLFDRPYEQIAYRSVLNFSKDSGKSIDEILTLANSNLPGRKNTRAALKSYFDVEEKRWVKEHFKFPKNFFGITTRSRIMKTSALALLALGIKLEFDYSNGNVARKLIKLLNDEIQNNRAQNGIGPWVQETTAVSVSSQHAFFVLRGIYAGIFGTIDPYDKSLAFRKKNYIDSFQYVWDQNTKKNQGTLKAIEFLRMDLNSRASVQTPSQNFVP